MGVSPRFLVGEWRLGKVNSSANYFLRGVCLSMGEIASLIEKQ
jgi:hypothetical protein